MSALAKTEVVGRLAPSPSGLLHLGHARTFLLAWWSARSQGGKVVLRIEDLDAARASPALIDAARRDLEWLGLDWDGPAIVQSTGRERLAQAVETLLSRGLAYACTCTRGDLRSALSAPQHGDTELRYPGTCRGRYASLEEAKRISGRDAGVRLEVRAGPVCFEDGFAGPQSFDVSAEVGDFLIARRDGTPAYQLAVVVDDAAQGVGEVLRGDDLLPSTARQLLLQEALALPAPRTFHVPLVVDAAGRRLAKREHALALFELAERGIDARRVVAWVARSAGLDVPEPVSAREVLPGFSLRKLPHTPVSIESAEFLRVP